MRLRVYIYALIAAAALALASLAATCEVACAGGEQSREYMVKAAMIYNFAKFAEWPADASHGHDNELRLCILGEDPFGGAIDTIRGKSVRGRALTVVNISGVKDIGRCDILFVCESENWRTAEILNAVKGKPVLTVSDIDGFARRGGVVSFKTVENKIRFEINLSSAEHSRLRISSRLLQLADIAEGD